MKQLACIGMILSLLLIGCAGNNSAVDKPIKQSENITKHALISTILSMTCRVEIYVDGRHRGSGAGTCVAIKKENDELVAYILTAKHVVNAGVCSNPVHNHNREIMIRFWQYGANGRELQSCYIGSCDIAWKATNVDAAIVKAKNPPDFLQVAKLMSPFEYGELRLGDAVIRAGCSAHLPPFCMLGYITKFNKLIEESNYDKLLLLIIGTAPGDSGGGIFDLKTLRLMAVSIIGRKDANHINGCVPITDILEELENSDLSFILED